MEDAELFARALRRSDFTALFDTAPDLSGADADISPYIGSDKHMDRPQRAGD